MYRLVAVAIVSSLAFAQTSQDAEIALAAKSPLTLARYVESHVTVDWKALRNTLGLKESQYWFAPCGSSAPANDARCSAETLTVANPEQAIVIVRSRSDFSFSDEYLRYLQGPNHGWTFAGEYSAWKRFGPSNHTLVRLGTTPFLKISSNHSENGAAIEWTATDVPLNKQFTVNGYTVTEMFSYTQAGEVIGKRMRFVAGADYRGHTAIDDINASWSYDNGGRTTGIMYPADAASIAQAPAPAYTYTYNGLGQLGGMTDNNNNGASIAHQVLGTVAEADIEFPTGRPAWRERVVGTVTYNAAGQLTQFGTEARSYNNLGQLTNITAPGLNLTYNYTAGQNNGKSASQNDAITGETVTYAYDSLNRLISAQSGSTWGQGFQYDGFGNLTAKTVLAGSVPTLSVGVDPSTNRIIGQSYDANGNMGSSPSGMMLGYDAENRMTQAQSSSSGMQYAYDEQNKRIWSCPLNASGAQCTGQQRAYFYGLNGKLLAQFNAMYTGPTGINGNLTPTLTMTGPFTRLYFGSRMLGNEDRLSSRGRYYPYGEDRPPSGQQNPGDGGVTFATYTRDSATGLNYADQRYYATGWGRFTSPDPYRRSGRGNSPQSWNRYSYAMGDPIQFNDPLGLWVLDNDTCYWDEDSGEEVCVDNTGEGAEVNTTCPAGEHFVAVDDSCEEDDQDQSGDSSTFPAYLLVTGDCYYRDPLTNGLDRRRTYELLDQSYQPMGNGITIEENIAAVSPTIKIDGYYANRIVLSKTRCTP